MRDFGIKLLYFFIPPMLILGVIEIIISSFKPRILAEEKLEEVYSPKARKYKWLEKVGSDSLLVLSGSSSVRYGLSCSLLNERTPDTYCWVNIAMDARDPIETYFILKNSDLNKVSKVYFGLDPWIYSKRYFRHRDPYMYLEFTFPQTLKYIREHDRSALLKRYRSLLSNVTDAAKREDTIAPVYEVHNDFGSASISRVDVSFNEAVYGWFQVNKYGWSELQFRYLKKIQELCERKNIAFYLFIPPKRSDFSSGYQKECMEIHASFVEKLESAGISAPVFGKFDQMDQYGDSVNFAEAFHLNMRGQEKYSRLFHDLIQQPMKSFSAEYSWFSNDSTLHRRDP